jgi:hypothetical protein
MWARAPETEGVSCGLGDSVADRLCREPSLRGLTPGVLARHLGVSIGAAEAGIRRIAEMAVGRPVRSFGMSLDATLGQKGRAAPKVAIEYSPDAQGGFATPAAPGLLEPGSTDPRVRSFTKAILNPDLVAQYGEAAVKQIGLAGLVPPPEDLDRVALFAPPPQGWNAYTWLDTTGDGPLPDGTYRDPVWADVQAAGDLAVKSSLAWWRYAYAIGPLPEDEQAIDDPRSSSYNWPRAGIDPNTIRRIYFWGFGKDGKLYKHMQVQKVDGFGNFKIFNQWGQNLTFVWKPEQGQWIAGWDAGDWFVQNRVTIVKGLQLGMTALMACMPFASAAVAAVASVLFGITNFGLSIGLSAAIAGAVTAQQAFISACVAIAKGDLGAAFKYFSEMGTALGDVPIVGDAKELTKSFNDLVSQTGVKALAQVVAEAGTGDLASLVSKAATLGGTAIPVGAKEIFETRSLVPAQLRPWYDQAVKEGGNALGRAVPWYAQGTHMLGVVMGTLQNPQTAGIRAPRGKTGTGVSPVKPIEQMTLAELAAYLDNLNADYARVAATEYGKTHPAFLAKYRSNIDAIQVAYDIKRTPAIAAPFADRGATMTLAQAAFAAKNAPAKPAPTSPAASSGSPVAPAVAGGILALLFFL